MIPSDPPSPFLTPLPQTESAAAAPPGPLPPAGYTGVWPPPIEAAGSAQAVSVPFKFLYQRVGKSSISDVREGAFQLWPTHLRIVGRAMPRQEVYAPIVGVLVLVNLVLAIIAHCVMRFAMLTPAVIDVAWSDVERIVVVPKRRRVGVSFHGPNSAGQVKPFCLCGQLSESGYAEFTRSAAEYAPGKIAEGTLASGISPVTLFFVGLFGVVMLLIAILLINVAMTSR